jgi:gas vesicle protein
VYFVVNGVRYWALLSPSGLLVYKKEGSKTKYIGRLSASEIKEMLAKAGAETLQQIKSDAEAMLQVLDRQLTAVQTSQPSQPSSQQLPLTWKSGDHTYWLLLYGKSIYIYMKGPTTRHRPKLIEKTDVNGVIAHLVAAGATHVVEDLRVLINGLYTAVSELLKPQPQAEKASGGAQRTRSGGASRREAEAALKELKRELSRAVKKWREKWMQEAEKRGWGEPRKWLMERLQEFIDDYMPLIEKILPYEDLLDKFADAAAEATAGHLTRSDVLEILK